MIISLGLSATGGLTATWLAVLATGATGDPTSLIQFGVLGVILMLVLFGFLWAKPSVDRLIADKEKAEAQRDALMDTFQTQVIPVLGDVREKVVPGLQTVIEQQQSLGRTVEDLIRDIRPRSG